MKKEPGAAANAADHATATDVAAGPAGVAAALAPCEAVIEYRAVAELKPDPRNPRTHSDKKIQLLAAAIGEFEVFVPAVVDENDLILAGHARVEAAKVIGMLGPHVYHGGGRACCFAGKWGTYARKPRSCGEQQPV